MPNWCTNYMRIDKDKADEFVLNDNKKVEMNKLIPMPKSYNETTSPIRAEDVYCYLSEYDTKSIPEEVLNDYRDIFGRWREDEIENMSAEYTKFCNQDKFFVFDDKELKSKEITRDEAIKRAYNVGKINCENYKKYGAPDWYEWRYQNWGVKWEANTLNLDDYDESTYEIVFDTPWGPPDGWLIELSNKTDYEVEYEIEGGYEARGTVTAKDGNIIFEDLEPYRWYDTPEDGLFIDAYAPFSIVDSSLAIKSGLIIQPFFMINDDSK